MSERKYFPLSLDQRTIVSWAGAAPAGLLNLALRLDIESEIDEELFKKALAVTCELLPYSRVRLHDEADGTTVQYISDMEEQQLPEWVECADWSDRKLSR